MLYSPTCQYALRALIYLASQKNADPVLGRKIAEDEGIPKQFLSKILHLLRNKGLIITTKGPGGGYRLARPAQRISLGQVVEAIDGKMDISQRCILGLDKCSDEESCALHDQWKKFQKQYLSTIKGLNLEQAATTLKRKRKAAKAR